MRQEKRLIVRVTSRAGEDHLEDWGPCQTAQEALARCEAEDLEPGDGQGWEPFLVDCVVGGGGKVFVPLYLDAGLVSEKYQAY